MQNELMLRALLIVKETCPPEHHREIGSCGIKRCSNCWIEYLKKEIMDEK
jgi:hypothetical protein